MIYDITYKIDETEHIISFGDDGETVDMFNLLTFLTNINNGTIPTVINIEKNKILND